MSHLHKPQSSFSTDEAQHLAQWGFIAFKHQDDNDKRIANALHEALEMLAKHHRSASLADQKRMTKEWESLVGMRLNESIGMVIDACLNTGQYDRGLALCDILVKDALLSPNECRAERAEFYTRRGETEKAEQMLLEALHENENDVWSYIHLGDIYSLWQIQDEYQNLDKAEAWYYCGYDHGLGDTTDEGGQVLLERLGDVCIDRLRRASEQRLLGYMAQYRIGGWHTLVQLRQQVYLVGLNSVLFNHLTHRIHETGASIEKMNEALQIFTDAYNLMPQRHLDGLSPFEMIAFMPRSPTEERIQAEMMASVEEQLHTMSEADMRGGQWSEAFSQFQSNFLRGKDPITGKIRRKAIDAERKKTRRDYENGKLIWMGFLDYRQRI